MNWINQIRPSILRLFTLAAMIGGIQVSAQEPDILGLIKANAIFDEVTKTAPQADEIEVLERWVERLRAEMGADNTVMLLGLGRLGLAHYNRFEYNLALVRFEQQHAQADQQFGPRHPVTLSALTNLAGVLLAQGDFDGARSRLEQVIERWTEIFGPDHPAALNALHALAQTHLAQGDLDGARSRLEQVIERRTAIFGPDHPDTLGALSNLADTLSALGDLGEARTLQERVLQQSTATLGADHPSTLDALNSLAHTLATHGDLEGAKQRIEQVLQRSTATLGPDHPRTFNTLGSLALTLSAHGDPEGAKQLRKQAFQRSTAIFGPDHPNTIAALSHLARTLHSLGDLEGAKLRLEQVLQRRTSTLGPEHYYTLETMLSLASTLKELGEREGAGALLHQVANALAIRAGEFRKATPLDLRSRNALALLQHDLGDLEHAGELLIAALDALENLSDRFDLTERVRSSLLASRRIIYDKALTVALERGRTDEAFHVLERSRARSLLNLLRWGQNVLTVSEISTGLRDVGRRLDARRRELQDLEADSGSASTSALNNEIAELQRRRGVLLGRYARNAQGKSRRAALNAEEVLRSLEPGTALLAFSVNREGLNLFVIRRDNPIRSIPLDGTVEGLSQKVTEFLALLRPFGPEELLAGSASGRDQALANAGQWLHERLLAPAEGFIDDAKRLLILPDGPLHYLPFSALVRSAAEDPRGWQYLVEWKPIHIAQSATVDAELRARRQDSRPPDLPLLTS